MGVTERKERHKEDLKREILDAALELFSEQGFEKTSIRNIAEKIEYSPTTIYLYFQNKNDIIHGLHVEGFKLLTAKFADLANEAHPFKRLTKMGYAYMSFAQENPEVYKLLFVMSEPMKHLEECKDEDWVEGDRAFDALLTTVTQCQEYGYFRGLDTKKLSMMIWSTMHGLCTLSTSGHMEHVKEVRETELKSNDAMIETYEEFVRLLERLKP